MKTNKFSILNEDSLKTIKIFQGQGKPKILSTYLQIVPCKVNCEFNCNLNYHGLKIPKSITNYVIVDTSYLINFSECLELIDNVGFIITLSSLIYIQNKNRKLYYKMKKLFEDPAKTIVLFQNKYHKDCYLNQGDNEDPMNFITRENYTVADFYLNHLNNNNADIVLMTDNSDSLIQQEKKINVNKKKSVLTLKIKDYLDIYQNDNSSAKELINSLEAALEANKIKDIGFISSEVSFEKVQDYLPDEILVSSLKSGNFFKGIIRVNKFRSRDEATVILSEGNSTKQLFGLTNEILIQGQVNRNRAIDGDYVIIEMLPESQWIEKKLEIADSEANAELAVPIIEDSEPRSFGVTSVHKTVTGRVVGIHKRNWRDYVCSFEPGESNTGKYVLATPFDRRVTRIRIGVSDISKLKSNRFIVRIDNWPVDSRYPNGHFVETLGPIGDLNTETKALLIEYRLYNRPFTASQLAELPINTPENPWKIDMDELSKRRDLRSMLIFSIDPIGCQDVDDTLSIRTLPNGNIELGVHIADVTHFIPSNSLLDLEARKRSTSIYMADRRFDMLPHVLSGDLCSLWSDVDRYAVSVTWELSQKLEVLSVDYFRSVIRSQFKLDYQLAQDIHDGKIGFINGLDMIPELKRAHQAKGDGAARFDELKRSISMLHGVASVLKERRMAEGGLELDGMEVIVKFSDPDRKDLEDLSQKQSLEMNETIAECMIFANHWVAKKILEHYPTRSCLRRHPPPRMDHFVELIHCASAKGFDIDFQSNLALAKSLDQSVDKLDPEFNRVLRSLATMAMSNAEYFSTGSMGPADFCHYGLALPVYTHFTSPIRRYADMLVHRSLLCAIAGVPESGLLTHSALVDQCSTMNAQHHQAQLVQRASIELFQALFFQSRSEDEKVCVSVGVIVKLLENGMVVHLPRYGIKGSVMLRRRTDNSVAWIKRSKSGSSISSITWLPEAETCISSESSARHQQISCITVTRLDGSSKQQHYRLFDRVRLRVDVAESYAHGLSLRLELVGLPDAIATDQHVIEDQSGDKFSRNALFEHVRQADELKYVVEEEISPEQAIASLHCHNSLAHLFRGFKAIKLGIDTEC